MMDGEPARALRIGVLGDVDPAVLDRLAARHALVDLRRRWPDPGPDAIDLLIIRSPYRLTRATLGGLPDLRWVIRAGVGADNLDLTALAERQIDVVYTPGSAPAVGELAFGLLLALARTIPAAVQQTSAGRWPKDGWKGWELRGRTMGILGLGRVGRAVAALAHGFGMPVLAHNGPRIPTDTDVPIVTRDELLRRSDVLTLCCPLNPQTRGSIDAAALAALPRGAVLVNVARGEIVVNDALLDALDRGHLAAAGLDVVDGEPDLPVRLRSHDRVLVTPHIGAQTRETHARIGALIEAAVIRVEQAFRVEA
jgi:D-3-phosphoglycerate dehydrogenase / 2-oxoglutarate reductase